MHYTDCAVCVSEHEGRGCLVEVTQSRVRLLVVVVGVKAEAVSCYNRHHDLARVVCPEGHWNARIMTLRIVKSSELIDDAYSAEITKFQIQEFQCN